MKVKNIMFAGFASAILSGVCGAASAADYNLVTQGYVTEKLAGKADAGASYTKAEADALLEDKADASYVGTIPEGANVENVVAYVEKKTAGIASEGAMETLSGRVDAVEGDIDTLQTAMSGGVDVEGSVAQKIATAIAAEESRADGKYQEKGDYALKSELPTDYVTSEGLAAEGFLKATTAEATYQPKGEYQPAGSYVTTDALTQEGFLKATTAEATYQPKGEYQPAGSYVTTDALTQEGFLKATTAAETYQPKGEYQPAGSYVTTQALTEEGFLKATTAAETYQPKGNYQEAGDYVTTEEMNTALGDKQDELTEAQLAAVNSTIDAAKVAQIQTNADNIALKANTSDVNTALDGKLDVMENAGTYLVRRAENGDISYVSVEIVGETPAQGF